MIDLTALRVLAGKKRWSRSDAEQLIDGRQVHGGPLAGFARILGCEYERLRRWSTLLDQATPPDDSPAPRFFEVRPSPPTRPLEDGDLRLKLRAAITEAVAGDDAERVAQLAEVLRLADEFGLRWADKARQVLSLDEES